MRAIRTEIVVDAPPADVWQALTETDAYPAWNPHVVEAHGDLAVGSRLDITVRREGVRDRSMRVTVTDLDPERKLAWVGRVLSPLLFEGRHVYELEPLDDGRTRLVNREEVRGVLGGMVVTDEPEVDYEKMNRALAERVERVAPDATT
ncbi:SRPBCC domain-containing protein [Halorarius litoreus]|uniref:SRPBCC domain-containing protein n=1 Tax=Halorarius litoreus TaxID=2962676 RepID=UPI0020CBD292|nr:SRPBCC domain-containing protein [Halorarius litoreus]